MTASQISNNIVEGEEMGGVPGWSRGVHRVGGFGKMPIRIFLSKRTDIVCDCGALEKIHSSWSRFALEQNVLFTFRINTWEYFESWEAVFVVFWGVLQMFANVTRRYLIRQ